MKVLFTILLATLFASCAHGPPPQRNAELIVTYEGTEVHRAGTPYKSLRQFEEILKDNTKTKYVIFSARWCGPKNDFNKVIVLIEEKWWSHHPYWFKYILSFFLENTDRKIVIFSSFNDTITGWLSEEFSIYRGRVSLEYLRWQKTLVKRSTNRIYNFALKCWPWLRLRKKLKQSPMRCRVFLRTPALQFKPQQLSQVISRPHLRISRLSQNKQLFLKLMAHNSTPRLEMSLGKM